MAPGLTNREKRLVFLSLPFVFGLFLAGVAFAFYITAPQALGFLSRFRSNIYEYTPTADSTVSFFLALMMGLGITFQLPVVMFLLAKIGIVSPQQLGRFRKFALVIILIVAAVITPGGDPYSMLFVAIPTYALFEVGILLARMARNPSRRDGPDSAAVTALLMVWLGTRCIQYVLNSGAPRGHDKMARTGRADAARRTLLRSLASYST